MLTLCKIKQYLSYFVSDVKRGACYIVRFSFYKFIITLRIAECKNGTAIKQIASRYSQIAGE